MIAPVILRALIWTICVVSIGGILSRPRDIPEWIWAIGGAIALTVLGLVPLHCVMIAIGRGADVYLFLAGMMVLAELARGQAVFDWLASHAVHASGGSRARLFALVFGVGIVVTIVLSNDATAVVLTPAVAAAVRKANAEPRPYLLACAYIANAASFVLPISNPANLVVFAHAMPTLPHWLIAFGVPSLLAIATTFVMLAIVSRRDLQGAVHTDVEIPILHAGGRIAVGGIALTAAALIAASTVGAPLGATTAVCGAIVFGVASFLDRTAFSAVVSSVSWSVLGLVAGLFVLVEGLEKTGLLILTRHAVETMAAWPPALSLLGAALATSVASNVMNNLPAGLIAGSSVAVLQGHNAFRSAVAIGIDLGPNLSVTGSLATVLWLIALRREKIEIDTWTFFRVGSLVMPAALSLSVLSLLLTTR